MKLENLPPQKSSPQNISNLERLNQKFPILIQPKNRDRLPKELAHIYYARMELFRRICEARLVLRWIAVDHFNSTAHFDRPCHNDHHSVACYFSLVSTNRSKESALILKNDVIDLFQLVTKSDPTLHDFLYAELRFIN